MYADKITNSMQKAIDDNKRKRKIQKVYNIKNNITPTQIGKSAESKLIQKLKLYKTVEFEQTNTNELTIKQLQRLIKNTKTKMEIAAKEFDFVSAKDLRDKLFNFQKILKSKK